MNESFIGSPTGIESECPVTELLGLEEVGLDGEVVAGVPVEIDGLCHIKAVMLKIIVK